jgi:uncharacterized protein YndB with AHSA1/START domain
MPRIEVQRTINAPRERVWARYTDHRSWPQWTGLGPMQVTLSPEGTPMPDGVGCVRVVRGLGMEIVAEEVLVFEPPACMVYRIVRGGGPIRDHEGEVRMEAQGDGTLVTWRCRFEGSLPGVAPILRVALTGVFRRVLAGLARDLERG